MPDHDRHELLALAAQAAADLAVIVMDSQGHVLALNTGAELLLGYGETELLHADMIFTPEDQAKGCAVVEREEALASGKTTDERWHMRKDGSRFWGSGVMTPLPDGVGFVKYMRDLTDRRRAEELLRLSEERFRTLATNIPELVFTSLGDGDRTWGSPQWVVYTGLSDADSRQFGWLDAVHADDRQQTRKSWEKAMRSGVYEIEHRIRRVADGEFRWHQTRAMPLPHVEGAPQEWVGASTDVHQLRGLRESQDVLLSELQHRTRNLLTVVQSIAHRSAKSAPTIEVFVRELNHRLQALSRAESLTPYGTDGVVDLRALVETELAAHLPADHSSKVRLDGPHINIPRIAAQPVSLALHELTTNAVKYGALKQEHGRLDIAWHVEAEDMKVAFEWRESGLVMPPDTGTRRRGYGTELIEQALRYQLSAQTRLEFSADGVFCRVEVPIAAGEEER
jgi:PAS domain S-box-containing protein